MIFAPIWRGYVFSKLWLWFIVSTFGAIPLGIAQSIGLAAVVGFLTYQYDQYEDKEKGVAEKMTTMIAVAALSPGMALLFGWIVKGWL